MNFQEIDLWCDLYEHRFRSGDAVSIKDFLCQNGLPPDASLVAELQKVATENLSRQQTPGAGDESPGTADLPQSSGSLIVSIGGDKLPEKIVEDGTREECFSSASGWTGFVRRICNFKLMARQIRRMGPNWTRRKSSSDEVT